MKRFSSWFLVLGALLGLNTAVNAGSLLNTDIWNTGVTNAGATRLNTDPETHYTVFSAPALSSTSLQVVTSAGGFPIGPWVGDSSISGWIRPLNSTIPNGTVPTNEPGNYAFRMTFNVASSGTFTFSGRWSSDNSGQMDLDGANIGLATPAGGYVSFTSFTASQPVTVALSAGTHYFEWVVNNGTSPNNDQNPVGLRVEFTQADFVSDTPEPASMTLIGIGIAGMAGYGWRRRRQAAAAK